MSSSTFFKVDFSWLPKSFSKLHSNPSFLSLDSIASREAIHSVTHPDLALSMSQAHHDDGAHPASRDQKTFSAGSCSFSL